MITECWQPVDRYGLVGITCERPCLLAIWSLFQRCFLPEEAHCCVLHVMRAHTGTSHAYHVAAINTTLSLLLSPPAKQRKQRPLRVIKSFLHCNSNLLNVFHFHGGWYFALLSTVVVCAPSRHFSFHSKSSVGTNVVRAASRPWPSPALIVIGCLIWLVVDYYEAPFTFDTALARILFDFDMWVVIPCARWGVDAMILHPWRCAFSWAQVKKHRPQFADSVRLVSPTLHGLQQKQQ